MAEANRVDLTADQVRRRFLFLTALRWLPVGLVVPVVMLVPLARGLSLTEIGIATAAQGVAVLLLELPTGGLADAWGRRPVLLLAGVAGMVALLLFLEAGSLGGYLVAWSVMGVFRALESGPLESWYVDTAQAADADADIETTLARAGSLIGLTLAAGASVTAIVQGTLPDVTDPFAWTSAITLPLVFALVAAVAQTVAIAVLVQEPSRRGDGSAFRDALVEVPRVVRAGVTEVRRSRPLRALLGVSAMWGIGGIAPELLWQPRLETLLGTNASGLFGVTTIVMFGAMGLGSAAAPWLTRRTGDARRAAMITKAGHGLGVIALALTGGPVAMIAVLGLANAVFGATSPVHMGLLHRATTADRRATIVSTDSLSGLAVAAVGSVASGWLADAAGIPTTWVLSGIVLLASAPLYLRAADRPVGAGVVVGGGEPLVDDASSYEPSEAPDLEDTDTTAREARHDDDGHLADVGPPGGHPGDR